MFINARRRIFPVAEFGTSLCMPTSAVSSCWNLNNVIFEYFSEIRR